MVPTGVEIEVPLVYSKLSPGRSVGLGANHAETAHLLDLSARVGNDPVAADQLGGDVA